LCGLLVSRVVERLVVLLYRKLPLRSAINTLVALYACVFSLTALVMLDILLCDLSKVVKHFLVVVLVAYGNNFNFLFRASRANIKCLFKTLSFALENKEAMQTLNSKK
jgi:hypothetical protein